MDNFLYDEASSFSISDISNISKCESAHNSLTSNRVVQDTLVDNEHSLPTSNNLKGIRVKNLNRLIIGHLNINSIRNKFELLRDQVQDNIDVPTSQFVIKGYSTPFRLDRDKNGGGLMLYIREDIPAQQLKQKSLSQNFENLSVELNLRNKKWIISCSYNPHLNNIQHHLACLSKNLDSFLSKYENFILLGDFKCRNQ